MPVKRTPPWESSQTKKAQTSCTLSTIFAVTEFIGNTFRLITPIAAKAADSEWECSVLWISVQPIINYFLYDNEIQTSYCYFVWGLVYYNV